MYSDDKNTQIVISLLKQYGISCIVASSGMQNVPFLISVRRDPFFTVYSVVDERSAAYFATGIAQESGKPVVITCTGATASRNYLSALTEAFYRNLPIVALTFIAGNNDPQNLKPQFVDRTVSQNDIKVLSVHLPTVKDKKDEEYNALSVNRALGAVTRRGCGPVHINAERQTMSFDAKNPYNARKIDFYDSEDLLHENCADDLSKSLSGRRVGILVGAHRKFNAEEQGAIDAFIDAYDVAVFYDHTSSYHGKNKLLLSAVCEFSDDDGISPDIMIDIGGVMFENKPRFSLKNKVLDGVQYWRISEDGVYHQRHNHLVKMFHCSELCFFKTLSEAGKNVVGTTAPGRPQGGRSNHSYYNLVQENVGELTVPELPLSNTLVCSELSAKLPQGCALHLGINNSLRNMNFFKLDDSIDSTCNVGGYGIDGAVSTLIGQSMVNEDRLYFGIIGDLAFFYDMNALGIRHIRSNVRLLVVNNGRGMEFRLNAHIDDQFGDELDEYVSAAGHFGSAEAWARAMGFEYMSASTKEQFVQQVDDFCSPDVSKYAKPVLFEVFTDVAGEKEGLRLLRAANTTKKQQLISKSVQVGHSLLPKGMKDAVKKLMK